MGLSIKGGNELETLYTSSAAKGCKSSQVILAAYKLGIPLVKAVGGRDYLFTKQQIKKIEAFVRK